MLQSLQPAAAGVVVPKITSHDHGIWLVDSNVGMPVAFRVPVVVGAGQALLHAAEEMVVRKLQQTERLARAQLQRGHRILIRPGPTAASDLRRGAGAFAGVQTRARWESQNSTQHRGRDSQKITAIQHGGIINDPFNEDNPQPERQCQMISSLTFAFGFWRGELPAFA